MKLRRWPIFERLPLFDDFKCMPTSASFEPMEHEVILVFGIRACLGTLEAVVELLTAAR